MKRGKKGERTLGAADVQHGAFNTRLFQTADLVQLLIVGDGQKDVSGRDAAFLVVSGSITRQLQDLSCNSR